MIFSRGRVWAVALVLICAAAPAYAQTRPSTPLPQVEGAFEKKALVKPTNTPAKPNTAPSAQSPTMLTNGMDTTRVVLSLALVLAAIFLLRWIAQQVLGTPSAKRSSRAVQVLSRSMIAPKQHVLVLQVGKRLLIVGDTGSQMNPLCEITDADEIAMMLSQLKQEKAPVAKAFGSVFGRAQKDFADDDSSVEPTERESEADPEVDPAMATTQAELSSLMDKVRSVSKQLGQG